MLNISNVINAKGKVYSLSEVTESKKDFSLNTLYKGKESKCRIVNNIIK
jgi:hypothetical protein